MDPATLLLITQLIQVAFGGANIAIEEILKLKKLLALSPDVAGNIKSALADSDAADDDTIARVNAWMAANNLPQA